jgi:hypothetical protein
MKIRLVLLALIALFLSLPNSAASAQTGTDNLAGGQTAECHSHGCDGAVLPRTTVNLTGGKPLIGLPPSTVMGFPILCSPDGTTFVEVYENATNSVNRFPDLYSVSILGEVKRLNRPIPTGYQGLAVRSLFPGEHTIVSLIQAYGKKDLSPDTPKTEVNFISLIDREGGSEKLLELKLKFQPLKLAVLGSGKFIVLGLDTANLVPVLALLDEDGTLLRVIDLDNRKYDNSKDLGEIYKQAKEGESAAAKRKQITGALASASFVAHGSKVLLVQPGSKLYVHILGEGGDEGAVPITLSSDFLVEGILGSESSYTWVVRAQKLDSFQKMANDHIIQNPPQQLFEVNQETGKATRAIDIVGVHPMAVTCAANKKLSALYDDPLPDSDVDRFVLSSAPR